MDNRSQDQLNQLARKMGVKNASTFLSVLGRQKQFINAVETPIGQELLKDAVSNAEDVISKYIMNKETREDRARLQAYLTIINKWTNIINEYKDNREKFDNLTK